MRALCVSIAILLSKKMICTRSRYNAMPSKHFPHTSHCTFHTLHFALHTCTSSQLISSELFSSHFMSSHMSAKFFLSVLESLHKALPSSTLYYKACTKHFLVLLCTTKLAQSTSQYCFVLHSLHKALPSATLYYKACTNYFPALLLCTTTVYYYCVLLLCTTTVYYKACTNHFPAILCTTQSLHPVLLCTTKLAQTTS